MNLFLLMSVQAAAAPAPVPPPTVKIDPIHFDLANVKPADPAGDCGPSQGPEIVVCGRRNPYVYPLDKMARIYEPKPLRAETGLGHGATANVHVEQAEIGPGLKSNRVMVGIKIPF
ncbi:MAG TPA: hypothetical protein VFW19_08145 [Allosphingosinicella sp.]|nr:hypothetical protein [Allosphingosinicella sp.]